MYLTERAQQGQDLAMAYTNDASVDLIIRGMNYLHAKKYGIYLEHPYHIGCTAKNVPKSEFKNSLVQLIFVYVHLSNFI